MRAGRARIRLLRRGGRAADRPPRAGLRRGVVMLPSAFTLGNLFFGVYAMVSALRGDLMWASWCIVIAAILDLLDGAVARFTRSGSAFGAQLDSLVDAISFGVAPALAVIVIHLPGSDWGWMVGFAYVAAAVVRLARFNVEQGGEGGGDGGDGRDGRVRRQFHGLPAPSAAVILASHHPFSQTALFQEHLAGLPWSRIMVIATVLVSMLMLSRVPYDKLPRVGIRTRRGIFNTAVLGTSTAIAIAVPAYWFFPSMVGYALWGLLRSAFLGFMDYDEESDT